VAGGLLGPFVDAHGYSAFFTGTALLGLPVLLLVALASQEPKRPLASIDKR
jgi:PAT family beta-lactamase induction signal transducer AmpG